MIEFPKKLIDELVNLNEHDWRRMRAQVRWSYETGEIEPPYRLRKYMITLPEDRLDWDNLGHTVAMQRRLRTQARRRAQSAKAAARAKKDKREYMRHYMVEYRMGKRRRG